MINRNAIKIGSENRAKKVLRIIGVLSVISRCWVALKRWVFSTKPPLGRE